MLSIQKLIFFFILINLVLVSLMAYIADIIFKRSGYDINRKKSIIKYLKYMIFVINIFSLLIFTNIMKEILGTLNSTTELAIINISELICLFIGTNTLFANIFYTLYLFNTENFEGITKSKKELTKDLFVTDYYSFLYFSCSTFFTIGYGDIVAATIVAKIVTILEFITAFILTSYILTIFITKNLKAASYNRNNVFRFKRNIL